MKITITGSLGNISKPLAIELVLKGHQVMVISSKAERQKEIEAIGAKAAIVSIQDAGFLLYYQLNLCASICPESVPKTSEMKKKKPQTLVRYEVFLCGLGAQNRNRTCTSLRKPDFESSASTNSAIWALGTPRFNGLQIYQFFP